jgi:predicted RNA-binding protein YlxR (DUF448 family)
MHPEPVRMCAACHARRPREEFWRVVRSPQGDVFLDISGKGQGKGAYLCRSSECIRKSKKSRSLERALGTAVPGVVYDELSRLTEETNG